MKFFARNLILLCIFYAACPAQNPVCPSPFVYMEGSNFIKYYDPTQPLSGTNPGNTTIPQFGSGLTLMPNINGGTLTPTFYTTSNGNYYYWDGVSWVNTNHTVGSSAAVNIGGCGSFIYNLVGGSGDVYVYNGTGNGTLLTTLSNFSGGGPYDITTDCNCNFYVIKTTTAGTGQQMTKYSPSGAAIATFSLVNMPNASAGGGFGMICNTVYLKNNLTNGFFIGNISGSTITFTQVSNFSASPGDFASCPTCTSPGTLNAQITNAHLSCYNPTATLAVTANTAPVSYMWSGPGITGSSTGSVVTVNAPGSYTCLVSTQGCPPLQATLTTFVSSNIHTVAAVLSPTGNICISANQQNLLTVTHNSSSEVITWSGPGIGSSPNTDTFVVTGAGSFTVQVTDPASGCYARDVVNFAETPTVNIALSSNTLCALPINGSPASITMSASGATSYSFLPDTYYSVNSTTSNVIVATPVFHGSTSTTGTLVGYNGFCSDTTTTLFTIHHNPTITVSGSSICPGQSHVFTASGANSYTWSGPSLDTYFGPQTVATPAVSSSYILIGSNANCRSTVITASVMVRPLPVVSLAPATATICLGQSSAITATGTATSYNWTQASGISTTTGPFVTVTPPGTQEYRVTGSLNTCTANATATVYVQPPPTLSISLSSKNMCFNKFNGSVNSITLTPSGATNYTLLQGNGYVVNNPFGPLMQLVPAGPPIQDVTVATTTLIGTFGVCTVSKTQTFNIVPNPTVLITPPSASMCPGGAQIYSVSGASSYTWLPSPNLYTYSPISVLANPKSTSFYAVMGASLGCKSDTKNAVLIVKPVPTLTIFPMSTTVCAGNPITLVVKGNAETYSWTPVGSLNTTLGQTVIATPFTTQNYTVTGILNSCTNTAVSTVSAITIPTITAKATESLICSAASTNLKAEGAMGFDWSPPETLSSLHGPIVNASPHNNTTYTVWGFNGICSGSTTVLVRTVQRPDLKVFSNEGQHTICKGASLGLMASGAQHYEWYPPELVQTMGSNTLVLVKPESNTNFTVSGSNFEGDVSCPHLVSFSVTVVPKAKAIVSGISTICRGQKTTLEAGGGNTFIWSPSEGLNKTNVARVVAGPSVTTIYTINVSENTYCGSSTTVMVNVNPKPQVFAGNDSSYHVNDPIFLSASGTGSITWVAGDGIACSSCRYTQVYPDRFTCYTAEAVNEFGCLNYDEVCIDVTRDFSFYIPNSFTPNGDGLNDLFIVFGSNISHLQIQIFDRWGQVLYTSTEITQGWDGTFKGRPCKPDTYVYKLSYKGLDQKTYQKTGHITIVR